MNYTYYDFSNIGGLHTVRFTTKEHIMNALGLYQYTTAAVLQRTFDKVVLHLFF